MIRNLKMLGLALVAVVAMSAMVASSASAQAGKGWLTSTGPVKLTGTQPKATLTAFGNQEVECHGHYEIGNVGETPHGVITPPATKFTVTPHYTECVARIGATTAPATVTTNHCDFDLEIGETKSAGHWKGTAKVRCENAGEAIEVHVYSNSSHSSTICTQKVTPQEGLEGGEVFNGEGGTIGLTGTIGGIKVEKTGILCGGTAETNEAVEHLEGTVISGTNELEEATAISITDEA
jgi:hypothetical protein